MTRVHPGALPDTASIGDVLATGFLTMRALSEALAAPLSDADATLQSIADASPAKWHLAHTTWFFETFVLRDHVPGWRLQHPDWAFLFNSYYEAEGRRLSRAARGILSPPCLSDILAWRAVVNEGVLGALPTMSPAARALVQLGCQHEQQHQELLLTDILHAFSTNPLEPAIWPPQAVAPVVKSHRQGWIKGRDGLCEIGHRASDMEVFAFDCEAPRHQVMLPPMLWPTGW